MAVTAQQVLEVIRDLVGDGTLPAEALEKANQLVREHDEQAMLAWKDESSPTEIGNAIGNGEHFRHGQPIYLHQVTHG